MKIESSTFLLTAVNGGGKKIESNGYKRRCSSNGKDSPLSIFSFRFFGQTSTFLFFMFFVFLWLKEKKEKGKRNGGWQ
jgi:hypothetical protein